VSAEGAARCALTLTWIRWGWARPLAWLLLLLLPALPLGIVGRRRRRRRRCVVLSRRARVIYAIPPAVLDAPGTSLPVVLPVVMYPGPGGDGADGEPDEAGGAVEHSVAIVVVVPEYVVVGHTRNLVRERL